MLWTNLPYVFMCNGMYDDPYKGVEHSIVQVSESILVHGDRHWVIINTGTGRIYRPKWERLILLLKPAIQKYMYSRNKLTQIWIEPII